jgi:hypothetical protein
MPFSPRQPPNVLHGVHVVQDTLMEVVAEDACSPSANPTGGRRLVEVY